MMFELGHLMALGPEALVPALEYLFHRVERSLDGRPTLITIDEAWRALEHPTAAQRLKAWAKEFRKKNAYLVFATQDVADATRSSIMPTLLSACKTKILLPNGEADSPLLKEGYRSIGLSDTEIAVIAGAQAKRDYFYVSEKGRRLFSLDMGPVALAFTAMASEEDQRALDAIVASTPDRRYAEAILRHRGLDWAAQHVADFRALRRTRDFIPS
jgi:type IV secretion system protein TrbE